MSELLLAVVVAAEEAVSGVGGRLPAVQSHLIRGHRSVVPQQVEPPDPLLTAAESPLHVYHS